MQAWAAYSVEELQMVIAQRTKHPHFYPYGEKKLIDEVAEDN